jgi:predicted nuclease of predicted toxin-antitoxin system
VADALRGVGEQVEIHDDHLARDVSDEAWMRLAAANGWVVLTKDARIRHRPLERACLLDAGLIVFVLTSASLTGPEMAAAFLAAGAGRSVACRTEKRVLSSSGSPEAGR